MDIISKLILMLNDKDMWFTTEHDPIVGLFGVSVDNYIKLDEYGEVTDEREIKRITSEILNYIGDGAITEEDAIEMWIREAFNNGQVWYKDSLITKFKDKQLVDNIEAYELHTESKEIKTESNKNVKDALTSLNVSNFVELKDELERLVDEDIIDNGVYDICYDIANEQETKCADYIRRRSEVTNTDYEDEIGIEADYVRGAVENMIAQFTDLNESKQTLVEDNSNSENNSEEKFKEQQIRSICASMGTNLVFLKQNLGVNSDRAKELQLEIKTQFTKLKELLPNLTDTQIVDFAADKDDYRLSQVKLLNQLVEYGFEVVNNSDIKTESVRYLVEDNQKSKQVIDSLLTADDFDASTPEGKLVLRLSKIYNELSKDGYDVGVSYSNGEGLIQIPIDKKGGSLLVPVQNENDKLSSTLGGNIPLTIDNMNAFTDLYTTLASL